MINPFSTASELLRLLRNGEVTPLALVEMYLQRIDIHNPDLNAVIWIDAEGAKDTARAITDKPDENRPLLGLPVTVKESFNLMDSPTTWGIPAYEANYPQTDAVVVERLKAAGAIIIGKTNVPYALNDFQSYNAIYGTTNNPWDLDRSPGGSSGGSAAALAAGLTALEMGSDIGGSIRNPAHYCGVFGHKPTWNLIPGRGQALPGNVVAPDIAVVGPLARSAFDLELQLDLLAKPDGINNGLQYDLKGLGTKTIKDLRVAVWANDDVASVSQDVERSVNQVATFFSNAGAHVDHTARPDFTSEHTQDVYQTLILSFMSAALPPDEFQKLKQAAAECSPDDSSQRAQFLRRTTIEHQQWLAYHNLREKLRWAWHDFFKEYDVVLAPVGLTAAFRHDHREPPESRSMVVDGEARPYYQQNFWAGLSGISHLPSTVIPVCLNEQGLPLGIQLIGDAYQDRKTIQIAQLLEEQGFAFTSPLAYR